MRILFIQAFLACVCLACFAQKSTLTPQNSNIDNQTVSFTEFIEALEKAEDWTVFNQVAIRFDYNKDKAGMDKWWEEGNHPITFKAHHIGIYNCDFDPEFWLVLRDVRFKGYLSVIGCTNLKILLKNSTFEKTLRMNANEAEFMEFLDCDFKLGFKYERGIVSDHLKFEKCKFSIDTQALSEFRGLDVNDYMFQVVSRTDPIDLEINECSFSTPDSLLQNPSFFVRLTKAKFGGLKILNSTFNAVVDIRSSNIENQFTTQKCQFKQGVLTSGMSMNQMNSTIDWNTLKDNKLLIFDEANKQIVSGKSILGDHEAAQYNALISCYSNFYYTFKTQGNRFFSNQCYVEWKDIETRYQYQLYKAKGSTNAYFIYLMNLFLDYFCDYATNPIKAIYKSTLVILVFAFIYFIAPTQVKDRPSRGFYSQVALYNDYLSSSKTFQETFETHIAQFTPQTPQNIVSSKSPKFMQWFGKRFDYFSPFVWLEKQLYRKFDLGGYTWETLPPKKRWRVSIFIFALTLISLFYYLIVRAIESIILSINVFSTLGFGEMRVAGFTTYLTVIEGFIGWFLLSIFSVALLNQILQ